MLIVDGDPNRRSVGSFFTNPIVGAAEADAVAARAVALGAIARPDEMPRWPAAGGAVKLSAGWLIERAGIRKGQRRGAVGVSTAHALALVHLGGGSTAGLLELAREVGDAVHGAVRYDIAARTDDDRRCMAAAQNLTKSPNPARLKAGARGL